MFAKKPLAIADSGPKSSTATHSFSGLFRNRTLGGYRALTTDPEPAVVLALPGRKYVITPDNPNAFVDPLKRDHSKVLGRRSIAELR